MPEPLVVVRNVSRQFSVGLTAINALVDVTCTVEANARIAIVGPSGSGKSTLLHLLGNLDQPTSGTITWPGLGPPESLRPARVVNIFQGPSLLPTLSVRENVLLQLILAGAAESDARADAEQALALFETDHLRDRLPEELSGGQAQRVSIARAIAVRPWLILADEPTGQLDSATAGRVLDQLLASADELGAALVISTHDQRVAQRLSTTWTMASGTLTTAQPGAAAVPVALDGDGHPSPHYDRETLRR